MVYTTEIRQALAAEGELLSPPVPTEILLAEPSRLREVEVLCTTWGAPKLETRLLDEARQLRAILHAAGSIRPLVSEAVWERGIAVSSAYATNSIPVAEFTLGAVLLANKRVFHHMRKMVQQKTPPGGDELLSLRNDCVGNYKSVIGLVSFGAVGRLVRERLRPFDLHILTYDPFLSEQEAERFQVERVSLTDLFARSDVVSLHSPLLDTTHGFIRGDHFASMKRGATLINTARGALIREDEMIAALRKRPDLQVLLDVTWPEPPTPDSPLYKLPNVFLTPHMAGSLGGECHRLGELVVGELRRFAAGIPLEWQITRAQFETMA
jgi:phosphoglycerate dehydrogenase-like enzyme